jgi:transposase
MWGILSSVLYKWYRNYLSDYCPDKSSGKCPQRFIESIDESTGEVIKEKPIYVFNPENIGKEMSIDDKAIGKDGYTILSNTQTNKITMMIESTNEKELAKAMSLFGEDLLKIESISSDMDPTYLKLCADQIPCAKIVIDKFHVMRYVYDAVLDVRTKIKKELAEGLSKGKKKTEKDKEILCEIGLLNRCLRKLTQSPDKWNDTTTELMANVFSKYKKLKTAYDLSQDFKKWYDISSYKLDKTKIKDNLWQWYQEIKKSEIEEFVPIVKMIRKHEDEILNYFLSGHTNAGAERLNGKIERFVSANYGMRDKDFSLFRIAGYFS